MYHRVNNSHNCICSWWDFRYPDYWCYYMGDVFVGYCAIVSLELLILSSRLAWNCIQCAFHYIMLCSSWHFVLFCYGACVCLGKFVASNHWLSAARANRWKWCEHILGDSWWNGMLPKQFLLLSSRRGYQMKIKPFAVLMLRFWCSINLMIDWLV